jgi:hypothetical protein
MNDRKIKNGLTEFKCINPAAQESLQVAKSYADPKRKPRARSVGKIQALHRHTSPEAQTHHSSFQLEFPVPRQTEAEEDASNGPTGLTAAEWPADPRLHAVMNYSHHLQRKSPARIVCLERECCQT